MYYAMSGLTFNHNKEHLFLRPNAETLSMPPHAVPVPESVIWILANRGN